MSPGEILVEKAGERVHGALVFGHVFAAWWNFKKGNLLQAALHVAFIVFEIWAVREHTKELS